ncbi:conserved exported hypothetical protein [Nostocoides japonicum T1-X7]|uniref:Secreted protein n=1 Tax=Nostocoides japonicum T1-X7 TaxID=1194083 RepID=A0A077LTM3_9MICO|nr:hypothetical protein [Tetrasphaera japonica]CCH76631.1 conserved exported hypothetical protein [Tetrasphaera japonica T1-X7]
MNRRIIAAGALALSAAGSGVFSTAQAGAAATTTFGMQRSPGIVTAGCLPKAKATVKVTPQGATELTTVKATGLPKNTDFDLFVIQVPNAPFGISWYQGDLETNSKGAGTGTYRGRFSVETFAVAPGTAPAPSVHTSPIADATSNPPFAPIHTFHLGLWFNSPADAVKAGCPGTTTPFNGEHNAGVQVLNTGGFPDLAGPLGRIDS